MEERLIINVIVNFMQNMKNQNGIRRKKSFIECLFTLGYLKKNSTRLEFFDLNAAPCGVGLP